MKGYQLYITPEDIFRSHRSSPNFFQPKTRYPLLTASGHGTHY